MDQVECPRCGHDGFSQISLYSVKEIVSLKLDINKISITARSIDNVDTKNIEHLNEFECLKCKMRFEIINKNGREYLGDSN